MPNADAPNGATTLLFPCPKCTGQEALTLVRSETVVTVRCISCAHLWSAEIATLPDTARRQLVGRFGALGNAA